MSKDSQAPSSNKVASAQRPVSGLVWHPSVHLFYGEQLYYIIISSYGFLQNLDRELEELRIMIDRPITAYETFGFHDIWLRFWANQDQMLLVSHYLDHQIRAPQHFNIFLLQPIWRIWGKEIPRRDATHLENGLRRFSPTRLSELQDGPENSRLLDSMTSAGLILGEIPFHDYALHDHVRFFLLVELATDTASEEQIARTITDVIEDGPYPEALISLARVRSDNTYIVEAAVPSYWEIDAIIDPIRNSLLPLILKTPTHLVDRVRGEERDFCDFSSPGLTMLLIMIKNIVPAYAQVPSSRQFPILAFFQKWQNFWDDDHLRAFGERCLWALVTLDGNRIAEAVGAINSLLETRLRDRVRRLAVRHFGNADPANLAVLRPSVQPKGWNLALGDSVELLSLLGAKLNEPEVVSQAETLRRYVPIRNAVHGEKIKGDWESIRSAAEVIDNCFPVFFDLLQTEDT